MFGMPNMSPLTGKMLQDQRSQGMFLWDVKHDHDADGFADFHFSKDLLDWIVQPEHFCPQAGITIQELADAMRLIRSYLWRVKILNDRPLLVVTDSSLP